MRRFGNYPHRKSRLKLRDENEDLFHHAMTSQGYKIRTLIVDDHELSREGISLLLQNQENIVVIGSVSSFGEALDSNRRLILDVILLDLHLPEGLIVERIPELLKVSGAAKVLALTASTTNKELHLNALRYGASGVLTKCQSIGAMVKAIDCVHSGEIWMARGMIPSLLDDVRVSQATCKSENRNALTSRQRAIAILAAQGMPAKRIAKVLDISDKTVRNQLVFIYSKFGVSGQAELAAKSMQLGLIQQ